MANVKALQRFIDSIDSNNNVVRGRKLTDDEKAKLKASLTAYIASQSGQSSGSAS